MGGDDNKNEGIAQQIFNTNTIQNWFPRLAGDKRTHNTDFVISSESSFVKMMNYYC